MKRQAVALILGFVVVLVVSLGQVVKAGKPGSEQPHADGIFDNSPGYRITGDINIGPVNDYLFNHTIYAHGVGGVTNTIWMNNSGDYVQNLVRTSPQRWIGYNFGSPLVGSPPSNPNLMDSGPMNVKRIGQMNSGETTDLGAVEFRTALGQIRFGNVENPGSPDTVYGSSSVTIRRIDTIPDPLPIWEVFTRSGEDVAVLLQTVKGKTVVSKYHMPFRMIIRQK